MNTPFPALVSFAVLLAVWAAWRLGAGTGSRRECRMGSGVVLISKDMQHEDVAREADRHGVDR